MLNKLNIFCMGLWVVSITSVVAEKSRKPFILDQRFICNIKRSCVDCLSLTHCSWCETENRCFSKMLPSFEDFCMNNTIDYKDNGFSLQENAECSCGNSTIQDNCYQPDVAERTLCSGRGSCVCGRCICERIPDPVHPTKTIMGEYCEFDNFSCEERQCNEGPYPLSQAKTNGDNNQNGVAQVEQPSEV